MPARPNAAGPTIAGARPLPGRRARGGQGRRAVALAAAALGLLVPSIATPQTLGISAGGGVIRSGPATTAGAMIVAPALELGGAGSSLRLDGQFARLMDGGVAAELSGVGTWLHPVRAGLAAGGRIEGRWSAFPRERDAGGMRAMLNATFGGPALGAAAGLGVGRFRAPADTRTTTHWEAAGWTRVGPVRLHASAAVNAFDERFTMLRDSVIVSPDSTLSPHRTAAAVRSRRYADAEVGAEWRPGRLALHLVWGARVGDAATAAESWGRAAASYVLRDGLALTAAAGVMPASIERGLRRAPFGRIGLRLGLPAAGSALPPIAVPAAAPALEVRDARDGYAMLLARVPGARRVEVKGDFTDWKPVELAAAGPGVWQARLRVAPGIHHVNLRVDGGPWIVPPGLPSLVDEFDGAVGILIVE